MSILIFSILFFLSILYPSSKFLAKLLLLFSWILFGWNFHNGDYKAYEFIYNNDAALKNYEGGYQFLINLSKTFGLDYQGFLILLSGIIVLLWSRFFLRFSSYPALFCSLFIIFFFPLDFILLRNTVAFSIVMQGLIFLFERDQRSRVNNLLLFSSMIFIAALFHKSSLFYFLLLILFFIERINFFQIFLIVLISLGIYIGFAKFYLYDLLKDSGDRSVLYQSNFITFISLTVYQLIGTYFIYLVYISDRDNSNVKTLLNINFILFLAIVLYYDFSIFVRLYRNIAIINSIFVLNFLFENKINQGFKVFLSIFFIVYLIFIYLYFIFPFQSMTIEALFYNNLIL